MKALRVSLICLAVAAALAVPNARAQDPNAGVAAARDAARDAAREALRLYEAGRYQNAFDRFNEAARLYNAPTLGLYMARCQAKMGKLLLARTLYREVADEPLAFDAPPQYREAQASSRQELAELGATIPVVIVVVKGADERRATVTIDQEPLPAEAAGRRELDPGVHTFTARAPDREDSSLVLQLPEGGVRTVELTLRPLGPREALPTVAKASDGPAWPWIVTAFAGGGAAVLVGVYTGAEALDRADEVTAACGGDFHCPKGLDAEAESARLYADVSTVSFLIGGVGLATGGALLWWKLQARATARSQSAVSVRPGAVVLRGSF